DARAPRSLRCRPRCAHRLLPRDERPEARPAPRTLIAARAGGNPPIWGPARIRDVPHRTSGFPEPLPVCRLENRAIAGRPVADSGQATGPDRAGVSLASETRDDGGEPRRRT